MTRLPTSVDDLRGKRAARWVRESSGRQLDKYGPTAQRAMQDRAIERLGLIDTGLAWTVAKSGWSGPDSMREPPATLTAEFRAMLAAAERGEYDVLLVGYTSRFIRDLALALSYRRTFHRSGVAIYLCDDGLLTSNAVVRRTFELSATGLPDAQVAAAVGLPLFTVRGMLTSSLYIGRLRDGGQANWAPLVDEATWRRCQQARARRATNTGRPADPRRPYALERLHCAGCGTRLTGDSGYYRHRNPCPDFVAAKPTGPARPGRFYGHAYRMELYEQIVEALLSQVALGASTLTSVVGEVAHPVLVVDECELERIERERDRSLARYRRDRDSVALDRAMTRLDDEARRATAGHAEPQIPAEVATRYFRTYRRPGQRRRMGRHAGCWPTRCSSGSRSGGCRRRPSISRSTPRGTASRPRCRQPWEYP
jgi:hypothetical protein